MARTNKQIQIWLDKCKYSESKHKNYDMSGSMYYCNYCEHGSNHKCAIEHDTRVETSSCAKAYRIWCEKN